MSLTIFTHTKFKPPNFLKPPKTSQNHTYHFDVLPVEKSSRNRNAPWHPMLYSSNSFSVLTRACSDGGQGEIFAAKKTSSVSDIETLRDESSNSNDGYVALFIRMLGLDNDPQDREQAIVALWKYSLGGKQYVDNIMKYNGTLNLIVNLLQSDSDSACEAAAGLLRVISSINVYRDLVAGSGAVEEITGLLGRPSLSSNVKEQSLCTLWNLSVDEKLGVKIISSDIFPMLIRFLEDEDARLKEAAGGVFANLTLSQSNHKILVEAEIIPKLAKFLTDVTEESKILKKEAKNALLEFAKDGYNKILIIEEGLVLVPLVGSSAYKSFKPSLYSWPSLPDGTKIEQNSKSKSPSRYGASELLLGLSIENETVNLEEAKMNAVVGRTQQQFLARIGAIEIEDGENFNKECSLSQRMTILPWMDGVARLVLILGLEDESAVARAAESIGDAAINEHMRVSFREAGAVKNLVQLIDHQKDTVKVFAVRALDRLSVSNYVCQTIEAEGVLPPLINLLKQSENSHTLTGMILNILTRILDPTKEMKSKFFDGPVNGLKRELGVISDPCVQTIDEGDISDSTFLSCLVDILKTPNTDLQRKSASILEFVAVTYGSCVEKIISAGIESGLEAVFHQKSIIAEFDVEDDKEPEQKILELEEVGLAVSSASRLLTRLLDHSQFLQTIDSHHFTKLLRNILKSNIPLHNKEWVSACLIKLASLPDNTLLNLENPINTELALYETIPRLIEKIETSFSPESQETAVLELNRIISEGFLDSTKAIASQGGIFPIVKLMESGSDRAIEASLAILYNLSMDNENHAAIVTAGAAPILRKLVMLERPYWSRALRLLQILPSY